MHEGEAVDYCPIMWTAASAHYSIGQGPDQSGLAFGSLGRSVHRSRLETMPYRAKTQPGPLPTRIIIPFHVCTLYHCLVLLITRAMSLVMSIKLNYNPKVNINEMTW